MVKKSQTKNSEFDIQKVCVQWFHIARPKWFIFCVPNEGKRSPYTAGKLKAQGLKSGVADLVIMCPCGKVCFIEMKTPTGVQSPMQKAFEKTCAALGFEYHIAKSFDEFKKIVDGLN